MHYHFEWLFFLHLTSLTSYPPLVPAETSLSEASNTNMDEYLWLCSCPFPAVTSLSSGSQSWWTPLRSFSADSAATSSSSCQSLSGPTPRRTCRRLPAHGCPNLSRHTGSTPCLASESHTQLCHGPPEPPPAGSYQEERKRAWGGQEKRPISRRSGEQGKIFMERLRS